MNQIILSGRITHDIELKYTQSNKPLVNFTLAVNRIGQDGTDFINCIVWNKQAENLHKYQSKGSMILVEGNLRVEKYKNKDGDNRYKTYVLVNHIEYIGTKKPSAENSAENAEESAEEEKNPFEEFGEELDPDDLPF